MKRIFHFLLCLTLVFSLITPFHAYAEATWPDFVPIQAEGGIVMDAGTGNGISVCDGDGDEHGSCII